MESFLNGDREDFLFDPPRTLRRFIEIGFDKDPLLSFCGSLALSRLLFVPKEDKPMVLGTSRSFWTDAGVCSVRLEL